MAVRINIEATLRRIMEYAAHSEVSRPLLIRTDSMLTSDILYQASICLIKNVGVVTAVLTSISDNGLNIMYMLGTDDPLEIGTQIELIGDRPFIFIVDQDYEDDPGDRETFTIIKCFNEDVMTTGEFARKLEKLPPDLFIFGCEDSHRNGLTPFHAGRNDYGYGYLAKAPFGKLVRVSELLEEINQVRYSGRSIVSPNSFPIGIDIDGRYNPGDDYIAFDMMSRYKYVDLLVDKLKTDNA